jgi:hypothetical protein
MGGLGKCLILVSFVGHGWGLGTALGVGRKFKPVSPSCGGDSRAKDTILYPLPNIGDLDYFSIRVFTEKHPCFYGWGGLGETLKTGKVLVSIVGCYAGSNVLQIYDGRVFTTNVYAENQTLINHKCVCGALNRHFCQTPVIGCPSVYQ